MCLRLPTSTCLIGTNASPIVANGRRQSRKGWPHYCDFPVGIPVSDYKEVFWETRKGTNRPPIRRVIDCLVYTMFWKITAFEHFRPTSGGRKCQKTHLLIHTKTFHLNLFTCFYDIRYKNTAWKSSCFEKPLF